MKNNNQEIDVEKFKEQFGKAKWFFWLILAGFAFDSFGDIFSLISNNKNMGFLTIIIIAIVILLVSIKQVNQYEKGVKFTMGRFSGIMAPGWRIVIPIFQSHRKVDMRIRAVDVPDQEAITKDNISVTVNAVIYYKLSDAEKAVIEVEDFFFAVSQLAQTTMRNVVGEVDLDELLSNRDAIAEKIRLIVDKATDAWGVSAKTTVLD